MKKWLLKPPSTDEIIRLLMAWRVWVGGAVIGALMATAAFYISPPSYRATATVLVDQNAEQAIPEERSDLVIYTFLGRETDKLWEIAWSDQVLQKVADESGIPLSELRNKRLHLSQPSDGGWHFSADAPDPQTAENMASAWAGSFVDVVLTRPPVLNPLLEIEYTQAQDLPVQRTVAAGVYVMAGAVIGVGLLAIGLLFFDRKDA